PPGLPDTLSVIVTTLGGATTTLTSPPGGGVTVLDATLTSLNGTTIVGVEGSPTSSVLIGAFTDANPGATSADFTSGGGSVVVNWGDGSAPQTLTAANLTANGSPAGVVFSISAPHTYAEEGPYLVAITVTDDGGATTIISSAAAITDAALTAGAPVAFSATTGVPFTNVVVGRFTDANTGAPASDFTAIIDWGDGTLTSVGTVVSTGGGGFNVLGSHTYVNPGVYTTSIVVTDDGGSHVTLTGSAGAGTGTVTDLPVTGAVRSFTAVEGQNTGTIVLATFTDPNPFATISSVTATLPIGGWGDGTPIAPVTLAVQQIGGTATSTIFEVLGSHTYTEEGPFTVNISVTTSGGVTTVLTPGTATVIDAALSSSNGTEITGIEGNTTGTVLLGTFRDNNQGATSADFTTNPGGSTVVNWGDGSAPQTLTAANLTASGSPDGVVFSISAAHTYAEAGTYAYTVTVTDDGGSVTIFSGSAIIADAVLTPTPAQPVVNTTEASLFPVPVFAPPLFKGQVATYTDANPTSTIADFKAEIDWGDGTPMTAGTISQPGVAGTAYIVSGSHTYADSGVNGGTGHYAIQVFVVDDDGSILTVNNTANVADNPIVLTGLLNPATDSGLSTGTVDTTNVKQPDFFGKSEPLSTVTLSATLLPGGTPFIIGQVEAGSDGSWNIRAGVPLADGHYSITATAIDQFGVTTTTAATTITANLLIDTTGPVIAGAFFNRLNGQVDYIIKDPVPASGGAPSGVWVNTLLDSSNYLLTKVHANKAYPGKWVVTNVTETPDPTIPFAYDVAVTFNGGAIIKGGYYLFTIRDSS
ncbi:MAG: beta strand repeat-containing protein, partial [Acidimicrobiales bacterium]